MKKILWLLVFILILTACAGDKSGDIKKREFTKGEKELLSELGYSEEMDLVSFDLDLSKLEVMEIIITIDHYKHGEFVEKVSEISDLSDGEALDIKNKRITWSRKDLNLGDEKQDREYWTIGLDNGWASQVIDMPSRTGFSGMHLNEDFEGSIEKNKKYPLAYYYRSNANSLIVLDRDFEDMDKAIKEFKDHDDLYILYVEIK